MKPITVWAVLDKNDEVVVSGSGQVFCYFTEDIAKTHCSAFHGEKVQLVGIQAVVRTVPLP